MSETETEIQWDSDIDWSAPNYQGIDFTLPSPTCEGENVGQTLKRIGGNLYTEAQQPLTTGPDPRTALEARDFIDAIGGKVVLNMAMQAGFDVRASHEDPLQQHLDVAFADHTATLGDTFVNPRYAQVGKFTSTVGPGDPEEDGEEDDE